jgi:hypothetical protein
MAIYNFDKSEGFTSLERVADHRPDHFKSNPQHAVYDHSNPDIALAEQTALENLRISGAWVTVLPRSDDNKFDKTWNEDANPTYYTGYDLKAYFAAEPPEVTLNKFGHDAPVKLEATFSRAEILQVIGDRLIRIGDVVIVPYNSLVVPARRFRVLHAAETGNYRYRWIYLKCTLENMNKDESTQPRFE